MSPLVQDFCRACQLYTKFETFSYLYNLLETPTTSTISHKSDQTIKLLDTTTLPVSKKEEEAETGNAQQKYMVIKGLFL